MSRFAWIDQSDSDRRRMFDVMDLFREQGTRDELGLGVIRDGLADLLFPGTGALQTRARYFFFVAWMFEIFEEERVRSATISRRARQFEGRLIEAILASEDTVGTIGKRAGASLQRMPSSVYWSGLGRLGIRNFAGSTDDYYRSLDSYYAAVSGRRRTDDGEPVESLRPNWHPALPDPPEGFEELARTRTDAVPVSLSLEPDEADYLAERIREAVSESLFAWFVNYLKELSDVPFAWEHHLTEQLPDHLRRQVRHARAFSEVMAGAAILYNGMVYEEPPHRTDNVADLFERFELWFSEIAVRHHELAAWDLRDFWALIAEAGARPSAGARAFVEQWIELALKAANAADLWRLPEVRELVRNREWALKKSLARLFSQHARETMSGYAGLGRLDFRWGDAQVILNDILAAQDRS